MGRKMFAARPRANTADSISRATLEHTDALPRSDLLPLDQRHKHPGTNNHDRFINEPRRSNTFGGRPSCEVDLNSTPDYRTYHNNSSTSRLAPLKLTENGRNQMIGIALPSPSNPAPSYPAEMGATMSTATTPTANSIRDISESGTQTIQRKPSKWKKFGGFFKAKPVETPPDVPVYQLRVNDQPELSHPNQADMTSFDSQTRHNLSDSMPHLQEFPRPPMQIAAPRVPPKDIKPKSVNKPVKRQEDHRHWGELSEDAKEEENFRSRRNFGSTPLLDVDIPDVEMERYSVMFGSLLGPSPSSNLLARRSKVLDKLKPLHEEHLTAQSDPRIARSATSPNLSKLSGFTLFPSTPINTPSKALGPQNTPRAPTLQKSHTLPTPHHPAYSDEAVTSQTRSRFERPNESSSTSHTRRTSDRSAVSTSPSDCESNDELPTVRLQMKPSVPATEKEPDWEIITPPQKPTTKPAEISPIHNKELPKTPTFPEKTSSNPSHFTPGNTQANSKTPSPTDQRTPNSTSKPSFLPRNASPVCGPGPTLPLHPSPSRRRPPPQPRKPQTKRLQKTDFGPNPNEPQAVEISVARSVSVTKRPKKTLVPISARSDNERIVEKRVGTPTQQAVQIGHRYAKSRKALIEHT